MNLVIDIGNTFTKVAVFDQDTLVRTAKYTELTEKEILRYKTDFPDVNQVIISSVKGKEILKDIEPQFKDALILTQDTPLPVKICYQTPETLGLDRIAAAVGAQHLYPEQDLLVIDAGTAITFDFVSKAAEYKGGNISPGLQLRSKALNQFTGKLPLVTPSSPFTLTGKSTSQAISNGVMFGMIYELQGYITDYQYHYDDLKIILTGGDADFFMENLEKCINFSRSANYFVEKLKNSIFVVLNLNLIGLNRILEFYVAEN